MLAQGAKDGISFGKLHKKLVLQIQNRNTS